MAEDGKVVYKVEVDSSNAESEAEQAGQKIGSSLGSKIGTAMKGAGIALAAVGTAAVAAGTSVVKAAGDVAAYGDNIDKMSQKMGMSAEAYQEWDAIMQHSGTSMEAMQSSMKTLATAAETGSDAFEKLGISQEELAKMSQEDLFAATITALQNVDDETERTYLAGQLLGRGATELGALLNTSAEDTEAMRQRVHELGGVMSDDAVKAAAKYQDSLQDMKTAFSGVTRTMVTEFLPGITTVMDGITEIFSGNTDEGLAKITEGIQSVIDGISEKLPQFMDAGAKIVTALLNAIVQNLPTLLGGAAGMITEIVTGLIQNLPAIIEAGLEVIIALTEGIADNIDELLPVIVDVVVKIVETLVKNAPKMIEAAAKLILKLIEGIGLMFAKVMEAGRELVGKIVDGLKERAQKLIDAGKELIQNVVDKFKNTDWKNLGKNIVDGILEGLKEFWNNLTSWIGDAVSGLIGGAKKILGVQSPSKEFKYIGRMTVLGMEEGLEDEEERLSRTFNDVFSPVLSALDGANIRTDMERSVSYKLSAAGTTAARQINVPVILNGREIARATAWQMGEQLAWEEMS